MAIEDRHNHIARGALGPYERCVAVTPNDTADLPFRTLALIATVAGVANVYMKDSSTAVTIPLAAGIPVAVRVDRVLATSTTATGIRALD